jgi:DNA polymerase-3 subunit delta'
MNIDIQETVWAQLVGKLDRLPHALLLHGAPGVGKLALAERFAQLLLCEKRGQGGTTACGACEACRWFKAGSHPDVRIVEPEATALALGRPAAAAEEGDDEPAREKKNPSVQIRIEQTRGLADFLNLASHRGGLRIAIVHPAEDMNTATANSLLKALEEPPAGAMFILVSHRPASLLPTIRSRCVPVPVPLPEPKAAAAWLAAQGVGKPERWLAFAGGAPLRALEYATGERGEAVERVLLALAAGNRAALGEIRTREELEPLAEVLQKMALDRAFAQLSGRTKYGGATVPGDGRAWLAYARAMGRHRLLARHPLNPKLFAAEMVAGMPQG